MKLNDNTDIILNSGSYDYKILFENSEDIKYNEENYNALKKQNSFILTNEKQHFSVGIINLCKTIFKILINGIFYDKIIFISIEPCQTLFENPIKSLYLINNNIKITKVLNINDLFTLNSNIFYCIDNDINNIWLISFGEFNINNNDILRFYNQNLIVKSIYKNINIKSLENNIIIKNAHNIEESYAKAIINFSTDKYIYSIHNQNNFYTFKINGKIIIICSPFPSGIVIKGSYNKLTKINGDIIDQSILDYELKYYFTKIINIFKSHYLFNNCIVNNNIKDYYQNYAKTNSLSIISMIGDSGSCFYTVEQDSTINLLGINICNSYMMILSDNNFANTPVNSPANSPVNTLVNLPVNTPTNTPTNTPENSPVNTPENLPVNTPVNSPENTPANSPVTRNFKIAPSLYWNNECNKLCIGKYIIEEIHKTCQISQISDIEKTIINLSKNMVSSIII